MLNLNRNEKIIYIFGYKDEIFLITNRSRIFKIQDQNVIDFADFDIFINTIPIVFDSNLIIFSVFGDIHQINLNDSSISKIDKFNLKPGISIKSNLKESVLINELKSVDTIKLGNMFVSIRLFLNLVI